MYLSKNHCIAPFESGFALAFSRYDGDSKLKLVIGYTSSWCTGSFTPLSRAIIETTAARLPPALSPPTATRLGSPLMLAAFDSTHWYAAKASSAAAGNLCVGA